MRPIAALFLVAALSVGIYVGLRSSDEASETVAPAPLVLGPVDGRDLPPTDIARVAVGSEAPDFALESYAGPVVTLSDYRGDKNVVLVFYRGHW